MDPTPLDEDVRELAAQVAERLERTGKNKEARLAKGFLEGLLHVEGPERPPSQERWSEDEQAAWRAARQLVEGVKKRRPRRAYVEFRPSD